MVAEDLGDFLTRVNLDFAAHQLDAGCEDFTVIEDGVVGKDAACFRVRHEGNAGVQLM